MPTTRYSLPGARALFGALGGNVARDAQSMEEDRLMRLDLARQQSDLMGAQAEQARAGVAKSALDQQVAQAALDARARRGDADTIIQALRLRMPEVDPGAATALVRRSQGGPFDAPILTPEQMRLAGETASSLFAGSLADAPTNAAQMGDLMTNAGASAQRLAAPSMIPEGPDRAAFMLNAGAKQGAPQLYKELPGGVGTFSPFSGAASYDPRMLEIQAQKATGAGGKPTYDAARGVMVSPSGTASPVTMQGSGTPLPDKPLSQADVARKEKMRKEAVGAKASLDASTAELDRLQKAARDIYDSPGLKGVTGVRGVFPNWPGGDAANAEAKLETLKSQIGFRVLQTMRDMSKTGGALGQVSDRENIMLQNNLAALGKAQSYDEFRRSLSDIMQFVDDTKARLAGAYRDTYPDAEAQATGAAPGRTIKRTGTAPDGRRVAEYSDGSIGVLPDGAVGATGAF
jgi:hypothetical protein